MSENVPTAEGRVGGEGEALGLYVHVPFCASTCDFCAFYQTTPTAEGVGQFLEKVREEAALVKWERAVDTVFWGGGTPGLLSPRALSELAAGVRAVTGGAPAEWTVEMAPASVTAERLGVLKDAGVTRISLGVQSFRPELLEALGRQHTREQVLRAYDRVRAADFRSVNLDLMFALPGQDEVAWHEDLAMAVRLAPDHLSTYCLTFEEDTRLWVKLSKGEVKLDAEKEARLYRDTWARLGEAGFAQYEVSNFARRGHRCNHNLNTWRMASWVGLGPSAASQHDGWRGANPADLKQWMAEVAEGRRMTTDRVETTAALLAEDALIFGLRLNDGVDLAAWARRFPGEGGAALEELWERLEAEGLAAQRAGELRLTEAGRLVVDAVGGEIMSTRAKAVDLVEGSA